MTTLPAVSLSAELSQHPAFSNESPLRPEVSFAMRQVWQLMSASDQARESKTAHVSREWQSNPADLRCQYWPCNGLLTVGCAKARQRWTTSSQNYHWNPADSEWRRAVWCVSNAFLTVHVAGSDVQYSRWSLLTLRRLISTTRALGSAGSGKPLQQYIFHPSVSSGSVHHRCSQHSGQGRCSQSMEYASTSCGLSGPS